MLGLFKLEIYSLPFTIDSLKAVLNTSQEGYIYRELLKSSCYIKVFQVFRTIPNYLGNISRGNVKETDKCFVRVRQQDIIYIVIAHSKRSR